jgi:transcriptional regulator with XRE-family HTH domain
MSRYARPRPRRLAKKLRQIRTNLGLTQAEMVKRLKFRGIYQGHVSEYERGKREPPYPVLLKYARLAGISTDVLIMMGLIYQMRPSLLFRESITLVSSRLEHKQLTERRLNCRTSLLNAQAWQFAVGFYRP